MKKTLLIISTLIIVSLPLDKKRNLIIA